MSEGALSAAEQSTLEGLRALFPALTSSVSGFVSLRYQSRAQEELELRKGILEPIRLSDDRGVMFTVYAGGGVGYAATSSLDAAALRAALSRASEIARWSGERQLFDSAELPHPAPRGERATQQLVPWATQALDEKLARLQQIDQNLGRDQREVDRSISLVHGRTLQLFLSSEGGDFLDLYEDIAPGMRVALYERGLLQQRSFGLRGLSQQGGLERLDFFDLERRAEKLLEEAQMLLQAPDCPSGKLDLVLAPDQMMLQIHESIGHPLELDRILGDERNYAGTSFVRPEMFGQYRYGSPLLNVTFDPARPNEFASYPVDDDGDQAERRYLIREGILERPLGGKISQQRADLSGVACSRACSWNRPPIDRMANINIESGTSSLEALIAPIERGVWMETNKSWSIDDSRNKFQFGCEYARLIENGRLGPVLKNPNYRGISSEFWRSLSGVGDQSTVEVLGTPYCGKGEPNQAIRVGHASPACRFSDVDVFGGA